MDKRVRAIWDLVLNAFRRVGLVVFASTAAGGFMFGPAGLAIGAAAGGAAVALVPPATWGYFNTLATTLIFTFLPRMISTENLTRMLNYIMEEAANRLGEPLERITNLLNDTWGYITGALRDLALLILGLLRRVGLLPASAPPAVPHRRPGDRDDGPSTVK